MQNPPDKLLDNRTLISILREDSSGRAFEAVYSYYYRGLCAYAGRFLSQAEAEEVVQSTMMWLWENRSAVIPELSLKSLLFTIVKNKSLDRLKHIKRGQKIFKEIVMKSAEKFDDPDMYAVEELTSLLNKALEKLPENYYKFFKMSRIDGKTHQQIAEELKVSQQTVNYNISQALKILRRELKEYSYLLVIFMVTR